MGGSELESLYKFKTKVAHGNECSTREVFEVEYKVSDTFASHVFKKPVKRIIDTKEDIINEIIIVLIIFFLFTLDFIKNRLKIIPLNL